MANTNYLKETVEPHMRDWVSQQIGVPLEKKRFVVGATTEGKPAYYGFNGVSEDGTVGVCISASSSWKIGQIRQFFLDATMLTRVKHFRRRIMVFTHRECWETFKKRCDGQVDLHLIEPMFCPLPDEMRAAVASIYQESAIEVGDKSGPGKQVS